MAEDEWWKASYGMREGRTGSVYVFMHCGMPVSVDRSGKALKGSIHPNTHRKRRLALFSGMDILRDGFAAKAARESN